MRRQPTLIQLNHELAKFNEQFKPGDACIVTDDFGKEIASKTKSEAWTLGGHSNVVLLEGFRGGYSIERVRKP